MDVIPRELVSRPAILILRALARSKVPLFASELLRSTGMSPGQFYPVARAMAEAGLVAEVGADQLHPLWAITPKGRMFLEKYEELLRTLSSSAPPSPPPKASVKFFSTGRVARLLGVTDRTVRDWIKQGRIRAERTIGGHYRIPEDEVLRLLRAGGPG